MGHSHAGLCLEVLRSVVLDVPSASGIAPWGDHFYVVGDNSSWLYEINSEGEVISHLSLFPSNDAPGSEIEKKSKPDFEAMEIIDGGELLIFGSGSKSPQRDILQRVKLGKIPTIQTYDMGSFYFLLCQEPLMAGAPLNIEAVAYKAGVLYLFNRGRNVIFSFPCKALLSAFEKQTKRPPYKAILFQLPSINGIESGFSGATACQDSAQLIFTSSVEDRDNPYDDGAVLGSFVGSILLDEKGNVNTTISSCALPNDGAPLKVESVAVVEESPKGTRLHLVTDSDGGVSELIEVLLSW